MNLFNLSKQTQSFVYQNILTNSNFLSGTSGWLNSNSDISASGNVLSCTGNAGASNPLVYQDVGILAASKVFFMRAKVRVTNNSATNIQLRFSSSGTVASALFTTQTSPVQDVWYDVYGNVSSSVGTGTAWLQVRTNYVDATTSNGKVTEIKDIFGINLTSLFGAGNEPSAIDCFNIFKYLDGMKQPNFSKTLML